MILRLAALVLAVIVVLSAIDLVTRDGFLVIVIAVGCGLWGRRLRRSVD